MAKRFILPTARCVAGLHPRGLVLTMLFACSPLAFTQWSSDPNINTPICIQGGNQQVPAIVSDGGRGAIIAWHDYRASIYSDIFSQRVNATGYMQWSTLGVAIATAAGNDGFRTIVSDDMGGAIIFWTTCAIGDTNCDIYAQRISASGVTRWGMNGVTICNAPGNQRIADVAGNSEGGAIAVWTDNRRGFAYSDLYVQRVDSSVPQWTLNGVAIFTLYTPRTPFPTMTSDGSGGGIVAWDDERNLNNLDVYAQRINRTGVTLWIANGVAVCTHPANQRKPKVVSDGAGGAIITWGDDRNTPGVDYVFTQRINASGVRQWTANGTRIPNLGASSHSIAADGIGGAIIAGLGQNAVRAHRLNSSGTLLWDSSGAILCSEPFASRTVIVSDRAGGAIVAWQDTRNDPNHNITDIYAQRVNAAGVVQWTTNGVAISTAPGNQFNPAIVSDGAGGAIITWEDFRSGTNYDIYAQQVSANGVLGHLTAVSEDETQPVRFILHQNYPNPFNPTTIISFSIPRSQDNSLVSLKVFDVLGREVADVVNSKMTAGTYQHTFDASALPSGIFFSQLRSGGLIETKKMVLLR